MVHKGDPIPENFDTEKPHSARIKEVIQDDSSLLIRDIHKVLVGDGYGNRGLIEDVKKNTNFRYQREEERRVQMRFAKIGAWITGGGTTIWLTMKEKIILIYNALVQ